MIEIGQNSTVDLGNLGVSLQATRASMHLPRQLYRHGMFFQVQHSMISSSLQMN
jgi:hypothetical protein